MDKEWNHSMEQMPRLLNELTSQPLRPSSNRGILPERGVYVFYENGKPIYTGRTQNMRRRLNQHCQPSSGHNSATFAFNIAKREAIKAGINISLTRKQLETNPAFAKLYLKAKERVSKMPVRVIQIDDPIMQTLFEVYAALALETKKFNDFNTH